MLNARLYCGFLSRATSSSSMIVKMDEYELGLCTLTAIETRERKRGGKSRRTIRAQKWRWKTCDYNSAAFLPVKDPTAEMCFLRCYEEGTLCQANLKIQWTINSLQHERPSFLFNSNISVLAGPSLVYWYCRVLVARCRIRDASSKACKPQSSGSVAFREGFQNSPSLSFGVIIVPVDGNSRHLWSATQASRAKSVDFS